MKTPWQEEGWERKTPNKALNRSENNQLSDEEKLFYHQQAARHSKGYMSAHPPASQKDPPVNPDYVAEERGRGVVGEEKSPLMTVMLVPWVENL